MSQILSISDDRSMSILFFFNPLVIIQIAGTELWLWPQKSKVKRITHQRKAVTENQGSNDIEHFTRYNASYFYKLIWKLRKILPYR